MNGFLNIDKPAGMTSNDVVRRVRRLAGQRRVGHGGTLDPMATGVLPIALGVATRLLEYLQEEEGKGYRATVRLGSTTDTDDAEGAVLESRPVPPLSQELLEAALARFRGTLVQTPPRYSAIRIAGRRLYDYARAGEEVEVPVRSVTVERLELTGWSGESFDLDVACSKGTYIRSLARDIGAALGCGGHLSALRRTRAGAFDLGTAVPLDDLLEHPERLSDALLPPQAALRDWTSAAVDDATLAALRQGRQFALDCAGDRAAVLDPAGDLAAIAVRDGALWQPIKVF
ncbi:MAG TPA: tRNA pseudouridine(55) synthase TruB [Herpetosiphonaceae bacterium]|nr:tRNA pseudouridine(55) synthase TruB [Herpetosiphonaceae bacterium]